MMRLNILLLVAVMGSAMYLVRVQYDSRHLYAEIEKAQSEARRLEIERERLMAEKRGQATLVTLHVLGDGPDARRRHRSGQQQAVAIKDASAVSR